jgi:uncharacterized protein DUF4062
MPDTKTRAPGAVPYRPTVYLSSTYKDLIEHRKAVAHILRKMNKIVVSMEDYTASDERPLDKCLADVAACDIYVGLFAFRYGFIPTQGNPENLSITELEWRRAKDLGKPCLIFIADETGWPMTSSDFFAREGEEGKRIIALRDSLNVHHTSPIPFKTPEDLAGSVSSSVSNLVDTRFLQTSASREKAVAPAAPLPRELSSDLFVTYLDVDSAFAARLENYLTSRRLRPIMGQGLLLPGSPEAFQQLERAVRSCHSAAILVSDPSLRQIQEKRGLAQGTLDILKARTDNLFALALTDESTAKLPEAIAVTVEPAVGWQPEAGPPPASLHNRFEALRLQTGIDSKKQWVGLPVISVAMTADEAKQIDVDPILVRNRLGQAIYQCFMDLRASISANESPILKRYGTRRLECRPFGGDSVTIERLLNAIVSHLNDDPPSGLRGRLIKTQNYLFDELRNWRREPSPVFTQLCSTGCVVLVDEYSLYHPDIREVLLSSGLLANDQVSLVTLAPLNPYSRAPFDLLETEMRNRLTAAFDRFASAFDPQCELSIGDEMRLKRWLNASLPHTVQMLREPKPNRQAISQFARLEGIDPQPKISRIIYEGERP